MHASTGLAILALASAAFTSPTPARPHMAKRTLGTVDVPTSSDVQAAINSWNDDVNAVNSFLESAPSKVSAGAFADLASSAAAVATTNAQDEPNQLKTLINWFNGDSNNPGAAPQAFGCATNDLANGTSGNNFQTQVLDVFTSLVHAADASDGDQVTSLLNQVNSFRCCNVLPDLDIIWRDSAISAGLVELSSVSGTPATASGPVPISPARPSTCQAFSDCADESVQGTTSFCFQEDNASAIFGTVDFFS